MTFVLSAETLSNPLLRRVEAISGQNISLCYQCGKCSAACPLANRMDLMPHEIIRYLQLGLNQVFEANSSWLCATCFSCETQCPRGIDVSKICEAIRAIKLRQDQHEIKFEDQPPEMPQQGLVSAYRKLSAY
jgi:heterodisulfide reductase subunit C